MQSQLTSFISNLNVTGMSGKSKATTKLTDSSLSTHNAAVGVKYHGKKNKACSELDKLGPSSDPDTAITVTLLVIHQLLICLP